MRSPWLSGLYKKIDSVNVLRRTIDKKCFFVLLNPDRGSWMVLTEDEYHRYSIDLLTEIELESLYLRGLVCNEDGEMVELDFPQPADCPSVVVVNITTACNLRCKYCFASCGDFVGENMSEPVMRNVIEQMLDMPFEVITFEIQGGEPLCFLDGFRRFLEIAEEARLRRKKTVKYRTMINGTLINDDFIRLVKQYNITFGTSIDGPKEMTDAVRIKPDGGGAFDDIMKGLQYAKSHGVAPDGVVCTLGQHNVLYPESIVSFFAEHGLEFKPRPVNVLGREIQQRLTTRPGQWATAYQTLLHESRKKNIQNFSIHIFEENVYTPIRDYICLRWPCGAAREIISVNPDGKVYPCDGFKGVEKFVMGNVMTQHIRDMLQVEWVVRLRERTAATIAKCSRCMWRGMCCSCCYSAYGAFGSVYREDPHCVDRRKIFAFLIDEWIRNNIINTVV